jgi:hypothetical protein
MTDIIPSPSYSFCNNKQDRQRTYNVTQSHIHVMFIPPWLSQKLHTMSLEQGTLWRFYVTSNNKTYFGLHINCMF